MAQAGFEDRGDEAFGGGSGDGCAARLLIIEGLIKTTEERDVIGGLQRITEYFRFADDGAGAAFDLVPQGFGVAGIYLIGVA